MTVNNTLREEENTKYLLEQIDKTCDSYSVAEQPKEEIKWLVEGHIKSLLNDAQSLIQRKQVEAEVKGRKSEIVMALFLDETFNMTSEIKGWLNERLEKVKAELNKDLKELS